MVNGGSMQEYNSLEKMIHNLLQLDDEAWGMYAFSRELLKNRIQTKEKAEMIAKANRCGKEYAHRTMKEFGCSDIRTLAEKQKIKVSYQDVSMSGKRVLFACFTPPDEIQIMKEPVQKATQLILEQAPNLVELFTQDGIIDTIVGHEIYHFVEEQFEQEIYTRTEKILLWKFLGFKNYSTIRTLGEIGAMAFTKELNGLQYSPFLLDFLLYYSYDSSGANNIYRDILGISTESREAVEGR